MLGIFGVERLTRTQIVFRLRHESIDCAARARTRIRCTMYSLLCTELLL